MPGSGLLMPPFIMEPAPPVFGSLHRNEEDGGWLMSAIPDDIMQAAVACWESLPKESAGIDHIARAILAERERCANVADAMPGWKQPRDVAKAIRVGGTLT